MNGSQIGLVRTDAGGGGLIFEEIDAFPLKPPEIDEVLQGLLAYGHDDLLVFFYARDWRLGEQI